MRHIAHLIPFALALLMATSSVVAQHSLRADQLPFMPKRDTTGIHTCIQYRLSNVVMGQRTALSTTHYDRHGYETSPLIRLVFDTLGRLTDRKVMYRLLPGGTSEMILETETLEHIAYSPEGLVGYYSLLDFGDRPLGTDPDTTISTYRLVDYTLHPERGVTKLVYAYAYTEAPAAVYERIPTTVYDTLVMERVFDARGRLIQQYLEGSLGGAYDYQTYYYYDEHNRLSHRKRVEFEYADSVGFSYNILSNLIGYSGKCNSEGEEGDVFLSCSPRGIPIQKSEIWFIDQFDEVAEVWMPVQTTYRTFYDKRGNISREETPDHPVIEYDYIYWDDLPTK